MKHIDAPFSLSAMVMLVATSSLVPWRLAAAAPLDDPVPESIQGRGPAVGLVTVATGLMAPNWGIYAPGDGSRLFVTDQNGMLWAIELTTGEKTVFLDVSPRLVALGVAGPGTFDERGLLGVAFHPRYRDNGLLYTYTSEPAAGPADFTVLDPGTAPNHHSVITEWRVPAPADPASVVEPGSARVLMRIEEPQFNHDAGALNFGADDHLYIALGDGGAADDEGAGHRPDGNGQDPGDVLGTLLRIDPDGSDSVNGQYGIPDDNPFHPGGVGPFGGQPGCADGLCDEIFAYGFRNPFRFSFDMATGRLYVGDVGQNDIEEVDVVTMGGNYGWRLKEGAFCFDANGSGRGFVTDDLQCAGPELIDPVAEYDHDEGIAIVGGFVYRGRSIPALRQRYVFGDFSRHFLQNEGRLFFLRSRRVVTPAGTLRKSRIDALRLVDPATLEPVELGMSLLGFGQDADGEIYVLGNTTGVPFPDPSTGDPTGVVLRIVPRRALAP